MRTLKTICDAARWLGCGVMALSLVACASDKVPARQASNETTPMSSPPRSPNLEPKSDRAQRNDRETSIQISDEITRECKFPEGEAPLFDLDEATLRPRGRNILDDVANCLKDGPLQNRTITLVGRADPRGSEEHNHELGANRAEAARNYLLQKGVSEKKLLVTSRGERGASGNEEETWALDRRVDIVLGDQTQRSNISQNPPANEKQSPRADDAASYADQSEGGRVSGKVTGSSGPGSDSVPGK